MLRVALVGAGGTARAYRACWARLPGVEWALAVDLDTAELERCAALGARRTSTAFADALDPGIDVVEIATPNHLHEEQAVAALRAGKHVLLQKPMANALDAADRILDAARSARGVLGMYLSGYAQPLVWEARRIIASGAIGAIQSFRTRDAHRGGLAARPGGWRASAELTSGGSFIQLSTHAVNLVQWWLGDIVEVGAMSANQHSPGIGGDDVTIAVARTRDGVLGVLESGYASSGNFREVHGTRGMLRMRGGSELELTADAAWEGELVRYDTPGKPMTVTAPVRALDDAADPLNQQRLFVEALRDGRAPHMTGERGRQDLAVVTAAYRSAATRATVAVPAMAALARA